MFNLYYTFATEAAQQPANMHRSTLKRTQIYQLNICNTQGRHRQTRFTLFYEFKAHSEIVTAIKIRCPSLMRAKQNKKEETQLLVP